MIHRTTKEQQLINPRNGYKAIVRATIQERNIIDISTDTEVEAGYHVKGIYEFQDGEKWVQFDTFERFLSFEMVANLEAQLKEMLTANTPIAQFDELFGVGLHHILVADSNWNLTWNDWE